MEIYLKNKNKLANNYKLFNGRNGVTKFVVDYGSIILEPKWKAAGGEPKATETEAI